MARSVALSTLLSQALVAFTIEFDNEFEHQMPHTTTRGPAAHSGRGPWLTSMAMWSNFMRFIEPDGVALRDVADLAAIVNLPGLERWRYVTIDLVRPNVDRHATPTASCGRHAAAGGRNPCGSRWPASSRRVGRSGSARASFRNCVPC